MKDIHSHILYGIDDGSKTIEESIEILKKANKRGFTDIVLTPHYIKDTIYQATNDKKTLLLNELKTRLKREGININLYLGNEVYIDESIIEQNILELLEKNISTINNTRYILIELPLNKKCSILEDILYELEKENLIPIIAHPERYLSYYKDYDFFMNLQQRGCLFQANIGSLYGFYGRKVKKMLKELLKRNLIDFFGTDIHHKDSKIYDKNIEKDLLKIVKKKEIVDNLLIHNTDKVLRNIIIKY